MGSNDHLAYILNGQPVVGPSVGVGDYFGAQTADVSGCKLGTYYNPEVAQTLMEHGQWSDGALEGCSSSSENLGTTCLAICCPCIVMHQVLEKVGDVPFPAPLLKISSRAFLAAYLLISCAGFFLADYGPMYHCMDFDARTGMLVMPGDRHLFEDEAAGKVEGMESRLSMGDLSRRLPDGRVRIKKRCRSVIGLLTEVTLWALVFLTAKGIRDRCRIREDNVVTCLKSGCCPEICLCIQPLFLAQMSRHVDLVLGHKVMMLAVHQGLPGGPSMVRIDPWATASAYPAPSAPPGPQAYT